MSKKRESQARVILQSRECEFCKRDYESKRKNAIYCSGRCRSRAALSRQEAKLEEQGLSKPSKPLETRDCVCGVSFKQERHWQKYCSGKCGNRHRQKLQIERKARELNESGS